jgi:hypothetical protein
LDDGHLNLRTGSEITVDDGAILRFQNQGIIYVEENGTIRVKKGGKLIIYPETQITLFGSNSQIIIEDGGLLQLENDAIFSFAGSGQIKFITSSSSALAHQIKVGTNCEIVLQGTNWTDVVLELDGTDAYVPQPTLSLFKITNGAVLMHENTRMVLECPVYFNTVKWLTDNASHYNRGLQLFGYTHTLQNLEFWNGSPALSYFPLRGGLLNITADQLAFKNCVRGLVTVGRGATLTNISGDATKSVWSALGMDLQSSATHFYDYSTSNSSMGIDFYGSSNSTLSLEDYSSSGGNLSRKKSLIFFGKNNLKAAKSQALVNMECISMGIRCS